MNASRLLLKLALAGTGLVACNEATSPTLVDVVYDFCAFDPPAFVAYQTEGGGWTRVTLDANNAASFRASEKTSLATVYARGNGFAVNFLFASGAELQATSGECREARGNKTLHGSLTNLGPGQSARINMGTALSVANSAFDIANVPEGQVDLIAQRFGPGTRNIIVRRRLEIPNGGTIEPLNPGGALEGVAPEGHELFVTGENQDLTFVYGSLQTATATRMIIDPQVVSIGAGAFETLPANRLIVGDYYTLICVALGSDNESARYAWIFFGAPEDPHLAIGSVLSLPAVTVAASLPYLRLRSVVASQTEYPSLLRADYTQDAEGGREVVVTATRGFFGGAAPASWDATIPDLSAVDGFQAAWMLRDTSRTRWEISAYDERPELYLGRDKPDDGETGRTATRSGVVERQALQSVTAVDRRQAASFLSNIPFPQ